MNDQNPIVAKFKMAVEQHGKGNAVQALALYDDVIRMNPAIPEVYLNRGAVLIALGRLNDALQSFDQTIRLKPGTHQAHLHKAAALMQLGRTQDAIACLDQALKIKPDYVEALLGKAEALTALVLPYDALECLDRVIAINPNFTPAYLSRGNLLRDLQQSDAALTSFDQAIKLQPDMAQAYNDKGVVLQGLGRSDEALALFDRALQIDPILAPAHCNRGIVFQNQGRLDEALVNYDRAIELLPDCTEALWNKSYCLLLLGRFDEGWPAYEWRKKYYPKLFPSYAQPQWRREDDIRGKTIFVHAEQGMGDTIQFVRYAKLLSEKGAKVILSVQESLMRLFKTLGPDIELRAWPAVPEKFDAYSALHSLPLAFGGDIPARVPYLSAEPELVAKWKERIGAEGFKVGISWQGNRQSLIDPGRSFPLRNFEGLSRLPNVRLISLQKNDGIEQLADLPDGMKVERLGDDFDAGSDAFIDTAAVMANLDLIITSDMAVAHVAGALGRPTWVGLRRVPDWRWLMERSDSPWYPTMRLFRQKTRGDWSGVFADIETALAKISV